MTTIKDVSRTPSTHLDAFSKDREIEIMQRLQETVLEYSPTLKVVAEICAEVDWYVLLYNVLPFTKLLYLTSNKPFVLDGSCQEVQLQAPSDDGR